MQKRPKGFKEPYFMSVDYKRVVIKVIQELYKSSYYLNNQFLS
jgi:hypothetical protein